MKRKALLATALLLALVACQTSSSPAATISSAQVGSLLQQTANSLEATEAQALMSPAPIVLVFWQSWCGSCIAEAPEVQRLHQKYGDRFPIFGVVSGPDEVIDSEHLQATIFRLGLNYPQIRDRDLDLTRAFQVRGTPDIVVLGKDRTVKYRGHHLPKSLDAYLDS